jgi:hypothetical protein
MDPGVARFIEARTSEEEDLATAAILAEVDEPIWRLVRRRMVTLGQGWHRALEEARDLYNTALIRVLESLRGYKKALQEAPPGAGQPLSEVAVPGPSRSPRTSCSSTSGACTRNGRGSRTGFATHGSVSAGVERERDAERGGVHGKLLGLGRTQK